jgi:hypothetical protein
LLIDQDDIRLIIIIGNSEQRPVIVLKKAN